MLTCFSWTDTSFCPSPSMSRSQTVDFPDAVPPATPIMKGALLSAPVASFLEFGSPAMAGLLLPSTVRRRPALPLPSIH